MILLPMMDEVYYRAFLKKLSNFLKPLKPCGFIRGIEAEWQVMNKE